MTFEELVTKRDALVSKRVMLDADIKELNEKIEVAKEGQAKKLLRQVEDLFARMKELGYAPVAEVENYIDGHAFCQWGISWQNIDITTID